MAPIPQHLLHTEVGYDAATGVAHRRAATSRTAMRGDGRNLPDTCAPNCVGGDPKLRPTSAFTASQNGASACEHELCFGRDLAEPAPEFRLMVAPRAGRKPNARR